MTQRALDFFSPPPAEGSHARGSHFRVEIAVRGNQGIRDVDGFFVSDRPGGLAADIRKLVFHHRPAERLQDHSRIDISLKLFGGEEAVYSVFRTTELVDPFIKRLAFDRSL